MKKNGARDAARKAGLGQVLFDLGKEWEKEAELLQERLRAEGISCVTLEHKETDLQQILETAAFREQEMLVLTDSAVTGRRLSQQNVVYFGCQHGGSGWFDGAVLVLESLEEVDVRYLEEWLCRAQGRPAQIAVTKRLLIREMDEQDMSELVRIGQQENGLALLNEEAFTFERLRSYARTAYRLQGYGLWSVLYEGKVIGCCGFAPVEESDSSGENMEDQTNAWVYRMHRDRKDYDMEHGRKNDGQGLELQYMLDAAYRRQGFGTEMCRAALQYADERLGADTICLRIRPDNVASQALAQKLGFQYSALHF